MNALILGLQSDIAKNISERLTADGWSVQGTVRSSCDFASNESIDKAVSLIAQPWDLALFSVGDLMPIGKFSGIHPDDWARSVQVNATGPLRMLYHLIPHRRPNACAVFFSGTNPLKTNPLYSAYSASKAMLVRAVQEIDSEMPDLRCFCLAPGFVMTKIHDATIKARVRNERLALGGGTSHEAIYACLKYYMGRPKNEVGGRLIHVPTWAQAWLEMV